MTHTDTKNIMKTRTVLYGRVSTTEQTTEHQRIQAEAAGYQFDEVLFDEGVSGLTTRLADRAQGRRLFDILRRGDTLVVRWVDRLGRNYEDVSDSLREFMRRGVVVKTIINGMTFDGATEDPMQKAVRDALIGFMAALSQAQAEATKEAQRAGIALAREKSPESYRGRKPTYRMEQVADVIRMTGEGGKVSDIAKRLGLSRQTVHRIVKSPDEAMSAAQAWGR